MSGNLELWGKVEQTPIGQTKPITGKSYSGTSPKPFYLVKKATETFGPCGIGWGYNIVDERIDDGLDGDRLHIARVRVWYKWNGERGEVEHIGGTPFSGKRKNGNTFIDEDAPKKSVTDALVKALSMIGFAGDIFMGMYDDSKYVDMLNEEERRADPSAVLTALLDNLEKQDSHTAAVDWKKGQTAQINGLSEYEFQQFKAAWETKLRSFAGNDQKAAA